MFDKKKNNSKNRISKKDLIYKLDKADDIYKETYREAEVVINKYNILLEEASNTVQSGVELLSSIKNVPVKHKKILNSVSIQLEQYEDSKIILQNERKGVLKESLFTVAALLFGGAAKYFIDQVSDDESDSIKGISIIVAILSAFAFLVVKIKNYFKSIRALTKSLKKAELETEKLRGMLERIASSTNIVLSAKKVVDEDYKRLAYTVDKDYRLLGDEVQMDLGNMFNNILGLSELLKIGIANGKGDNS